MKLGGHVSIAGGVQNAPLRAAEKGFEVFQMFSRSPHGGKKQELTKEVIKEFKNNFKAGGFDEFYIHAPYFINFASTNPRIYNGSISAIRDELERGSLLGANYVIFHPGSGKDAGREKGIELIAKGLDKVLAGYTGSTELLIENAAGAGEIMGDTFEEIAAIMKKMKHKNIGVCFDTCHAFASGYDLRTKAGVNKVIKNFDKIIGLNKLKMFHFNDSKKELNSNRDRHEVIGDGFIGKECFETLINHPKLKNVNATLETPDLKDDKPLSFTRIMRMRKK